MAANFGSTGATRPPAQTKRATSGCWQPVYATVRNFADGHGRPSLNLRTVSVLYIWWVAIEPSLSGAACGARSERVTQTEPLPSLAGVSVYAPSHAEVQVPRCGRVYFYDARGSYRARSRPRRVWYTRGQL